MRHFRKDGRRPSWPRALQAQRARATALPALGQAQVGAGALPGVLPADQHHSHTQWQRGGRARLQMQRPSEAWVAAGSASGGWQGVGAPPRQRTWQRGPRRQRRCRSRTRTRSNQGECTRKEWGRVSTVVAPSLGRRRRDAQTPKRRPRRARAKSTCPSRTCCRLRTPHTRDVTTRLRSRIWTALSARWRPKPRAHRRRLRQS